jgi:hypothetical protein
VRHDELGLTLHPFDLATNKLLALVGRGEGAIKGAFPQIVR